MLKVSISYRKFEGTKKERGNINVYTDYKKVKFEFIKSLLIRDYIYSPFNFIDKRRQRANIISKADFVVLDIDVTDISIEEQHQILTDENLIHFVSTTSDKNNNFLSHKSLFFKRK